MVQAKRGFFVTLSEIVVNASDRDTNEETRDKGGSRRQVWDRSALAALVREINATHFFVWSMNAGGVLTSVKMPVADIAQQVHMASRILDSNSEEAMHLVQTASRQFDSTAHRWQSQVRQSEEKMRAAAAAAKLAEARAKHNVVRTRIAPVQSLFKRAVQSVTAAVAHNQRRTKDARDDGVEN
jgi:hypothetical protein